MRVHVTGARGFIAGHLRAELEQAGHELTLSDVDAALAPELVLEHSPELVVHAGAVVGRELRGLGVERAVTLNVSSTALLADACATAGVRLLYLSSSEVYGARRDGELVTEAAELSLPHNLYGCSKRWGEDACRLAYRPAPELLTIARLAMPYGPGHAPGSGRAALTNFLWDALENRELLVHEGARRSWCWIGDTAAGLRRLAELAPEENLGTYNVGREDNELTMLSVAEHALSLVRERWPGRGSGELRVVDAPAGFTLVKRVSSARLEALGWRPRVELSEGMERTLEWLVSTAPPAFFDELPLGARA